MSNLDVSPSTVSHAVVFVIELQSQSLKECCSTTWLENLALVGWNSTQSIPKLVFWFSKLELLLDVVSIYCFSGGEGFPSDPLDDAVLLSVVYDAFG